MRRKKLLTWILATLCVGALSFGAACGGSGGSSSASSSSESVYSGTSSSIPDDSSSSDEISSSTPDSDSSSDEISSSTPDEDSSSDEVSSSTPDEDSSSDEVSSSTSDEHVHDFKNQAVNDQYLVEEATCVSKAVYYYSCNCGESGTSTFETGDLADHNYGTFINEVPAQEGVDGEKGHYHCPTCEKNFDENKNEITDLRIPALEPIVDDFTITRVDAFGEESTSGSYVLFGSYPQTDVTEEMGTALNQIAGLPSTNNAWKDYGWYFDGEVDEYAWYIDLNYQGERYRGVYYVKYRPFNITVGSNVAESSIAQLKTGYIKDSVYWFKYEPIKWTILEEKNGVATLFANVVLDSQEYQTGYTEVDGVFYTNDPNASENTPANLYEYATIRSWLNNDFYNLAFNTSQKALIKDFTDTTDKVTLPIEGFHSNYGLTGAVERDVTGYAFSQGIDTFSCMTKTEYFWYTENDNYYVYFGNRTWAAYILGVMGVVPMIEIELEQSTGCASHDFGSNYYTTPTHHFLMCANCDATTHKAEHSFVEGGCECGLRSYSEGLEFTKNSDNQSCSVSVGTCTDAHIIIPRVYDSRPVTAISDDGFRDCKFLKSIELPDTLKTIGTYAFSGSGLTTVTIPSSVETLGRGAFYDADSLITVTFNEGLKLIEGSVFSCCTKLEELILPNTVESIGDYAMHLCENLTKVVLGENITHMGYGVFESSTNLTVYCKPTSQPTAWGYYWNPSGRPVVWGYTGV